MRSSATFATNQRVPGRHPVSASGNNQGQWLRQNKPLIRGAFPGHNAHGVGQRWGLGKQAKRHSNDVLLDDGYGLLRETSLSADVCEGALKMQDRKMTDKDIAGGGKCRTGI